MLESPQTPTDDIAAALNEPVDLDFHLPDPEDEQIPELDFQRQLDTAWQVCDRFDLQTEIWRGRILRAVRDREKNKVMRVAVVFSTGSNNEKSVKVRLIR